MKARPVKRIIKKIRKDSVLFRILSKIPMSISPFRLINVRVGSDVLNHVAIVWRF
jgi:hypothetical protein